VGEAMTVDALQIEKLDPREGDLVVLSYPGRLPYEVVVRLRKQWDESFPGAKWKCIIVTDGLKVGVRRKMVAGDLGL
jgi:hypothetical protein